MSEDAVTLREAIAAIYAQVDAPAWAAPNLDALADVLRDLSWLPEGSVDLRLPAMSAMSTADGERLASVLRALTSETRGGRHPLAVAD